MFFAKDNNKFYVVSDGAEAPVLSTPPPRRKEKAKECPAIAEASLLWRFDIHDENHRGATIISAMATDQGDESTLAMVSHDQPTKLDAEQYFLFQSTVSPIQVTTDTSNTFFKYNNALLYDEYKKMGDEQASSGEFVVITTEDVGGDDFGDDDDDVEDEADETEIDLSLTESKLLDDEGRAARQKLGDQAFVHKKSPRSVSTQSSVRSHSSCIDMKIEPCRVDPALEETKGFLGGNLLQEDGKRNICL